MFASAVLCPHNAARRSSRHRPASVNRHHGRSTSRYTTPFRRSPRLGQCSNDACSTPIASVSAPVDWTISHSPVPGYGAAVMVAEPESRSSEWSRVLRPRRGSFRTEPDGASRSAAVGAGGSRPAARARRSGRDDSFHRRSPVTPMTICSARKQSRDRIGQDCRRRQLRSPLASWISAGVSEVEYHRDISLPTTGRGCRPAPQQRVAAAVDILSTDCSSSSSAESSRRRAIESEEPSAKFSTVDRREGVAVSNEYGRPSIFDHRCLVTDASLLTRSSLVDANYSGRAVPPSSPHELTLLRIGARCRATYVGQQHRSTSVFT